MTNPPPSTAISNGSGRTAIAISAGQAYTCAITDTGDLKCWGRDNEGRLGDGGTTHSSNTYISRHLPLQSALAQAVKQLPFLAIMSTPAYPQQQREMKCWGYDYKGQLGDGGSNVRPIFTRLISVSNTWATQQHRTTLRRRHDNVTVQTSCGFTCYQQPIHGRQHVHN